jgi:hypothetical protein
LVQAAGPEVALVGCGAATAVLGLVAVLVWLRARAGLGAYATSSSAS